MSDRDNITLPREVVKFVLQHLEWWSDDEPQEKEAIEALRTALAAEQPKHPGYVIGSHWLETAYSRVCAGEAEADVLRDIGLVREEAFLTGVAHLKAENERLRDGLACDWAELKACRASLREHLLEIERLREAMRSAMAMLDKHEPEPAGAFAVLLLALNPELQSARGEGKS